MPWKYEPNENAWKYDAYNVNVSTTRNNVPMCGCETCIEAFANSVGTNFEPIFKDVGYKLDIFAHRNNARKFCEGKVQGGNEPYGYVTIINFNISLFVAGSFATLKVITQFPQVLHICEEIEEEGLIWTSTRGQK